MAKEPPKQSDFPIRQDEVDRAIADADALANRDYEKFGWNEPKQDEPTPKPKRARKPRKPRKPR